MKITKSQLRQIIKEELENVLEYRRQSGGEQHLQGEDLQKAVNAFWKYLQVGLGSWGKPGRMKVFSVPHAVSMILVQPSAVANPEAGTKVQLSNAISTVINDPQSIKENGADPSKILQQWEIVPTTQYYNKPEHDELVQQMQGYHPRVTMQDGWVAIKK
jgi:hypothetical protein